MVLLSEIWWVWIPSLVFVVVAVSLRRILSRRSSANYDPVA